MTAMRELVDSCENEHSSEVETHDVGGHSHCDTCIKVTKCMVQPTRNESCKIVTCELNCGFSFHACKLTEHKLLCTYEKVACINAGNGCPVTLMRHQRASHLETCPASVVTCNMGWNRWSVCSQEHQMRSAFDLLNPQTKKGQLDVALVLHDQKRLNEWMKMALQTRHVLQNNLTKYFSEVPFHTWSSCEGENSVFVPSISDEDDKSWECKKAPPGLQSSVCGELYRVRRGSVNDSMIDPLAHITTKSHSLGHNGTPEFINTDNPNTQENSVCGMEYSIASPPSLLNGSLKSEIDQSQDSYSKTNTVILNSDRSKSSPVGVNTQSEYLEMTRDSREALSHNFGAGDSTCSEQNGHYRVCFVNNTQVNDIFSASMTGHASSVISPPPSGPPMVVSLGLDITLGTITRYHSKPHDKYAFLCAQEFRRDEYSWHYKNVHNDIHGGLNGWLEHRCPLAHYGCMYSLRRLYPTTKGATVIHNETLESFGVKPFVPYDIPVLNHCSKVTKSIVQSTSHKKSNSFSGSHVQNSEDTQDWSVISSQPLALCQLPFEVLRHVCRFLDSFSLCNLALTCRRLREVCCSLLEERGLVVQQWKKSRIGSRVTWTVAYKRWFFSTGFTPVHKWGFEAEDHMSNHLRSCVCFERCMESKPLFHMFGEEPDPTLHAKLIAKSGEDQDFAVGKSY